MQGNQESRRVFWPRALKWRIVEETLQPGASVSRVARKYGVNANQVFCRRTLYAHSVQADQHSGTMTIAIGAKRCWLSSWGRSDRHSSILLCSFPCPVSV